MSSFATHEVTNQSTVFEDVNLFTLDKALQEGIAREGGADALGALTAFGAKAGSREAFEHGRLANVHAPTLKTHDLKGRRLDVVEFHPSWHWLMALSKADGLHARAFEHLAGTMAQRGGANVERANS